MRGIEYLVDDSGKRKAVVIDLELHEELWEDLLSAELPSRNHHVIRTR